MSIKFPLTTSVFGSIFDGVAKLRWDYINLTALEVERFRVYKQMHTITSVLQEIFGSFDNEVISFPLVNLRCNH